ncbi:excinuclease UvrABC ATPase subunit [Brevibacterium sanguinis]|uniref:UvrABC system protein A n=2 Tax=Brevibacterium TaxID=1696 RepID=A0A366IL51_9MICO|nr:MULTISPECIES: excinuclease ABC subunit UvrA [Brevibacterium]RBP64722.1 excinuclease UvrABC ATPase subunit [Brevibacterium sanguinis]RBP71635.1 excinuclease UvrABC ATPase subunit [Brevibacterium celere]
MTHPADTHDLIRVRGARENNLKDVSIDIPKRRLTVFTGVSGSGKSSLVFSTIAAESQRMINETYSAFVQGFMPTMARPDVDVLEGLTTAIIVDQERIGANPRSTVGTVTDINAKLRILFSRLAEPALGSPNAYSFNVPTVSGTGSMTVEKAEGSQVEKRSFSVSGGMCPRCEGMGTATDIDVAEVVDFSKSLAEGAILIPGFKVGGWSVRFYTESGFFDPDKPVGEFTPDERDRLLNAEGEKIVINGTNLTFDGLLPRIRRSFLSKDRDGMQKHIRAFVDRAVVYTECPDCGGTRLGAAARGSRLAGRSIAEVCAMEVSDIPAWLARIDDPTVQPLVDSLAGTVRAFIDIGLGYLSLDRSSGSLSGGEAQRIKLVRHLGSSLTDVTYVFDEPTIGLHPHDIARMNSLLLELRDKGNTVLVVEHKPETILIADHVVDLGPRAGALGGQICYAGDVDGLRDSDTLTGAHLGYRAALRTETRTPTGALEIRGADTHNLTGVNVDVPLGVLTVVTGVAGSGKSSLIHGSLSSRERVVTIDQGAIKGSRRSNPATYTGMLEPVRKAFAKANGVKPALFSANSEGACPNCSGAGVVTADLGVMAGMSSPCEVCEGRGFQAEVLEYTLGGKNIREVLDMPVSEALEYFAAGESRIPAARRIAGHLAEVGLGYLSLGQPLTTLSGGERQRLKLATHLSAKSADQAGVFILDEPTTGLHLADVANLLELLDGLVDSGRSVIVIEHHQAVMAHADWIIDLGPGAGHDGGRIVFEGTPRDLVSRGETLTAQHLAEYVGAREPA